MKVDGKELSEATVKKACEAYGISFEEKKFEKIEFCHLRVGVNASEDRIVLGWEHSKELCHETINGIRNHIAALQSAINYVENK